MITEVNGKKVNCKLVRKNGGDISDNRNVWLCETANNCETCMWNQKYAKSVTFQYRPLTRNELKRLKDKYGITETNLECLERV